MAPTPCESVQWFQPTCRGVENLLLDRIECANRLERFESPPLCDHAIDVLELGKNLFILEAGQQHNHRFAEHAHRLFGAFRIDQHHLHDEVELAQRRRGLLGLQHVVFKQKVTSLRNSSATLRSTRSTAPLMKIRSPALSDMRSELFISARP
jgi:hypothetical protein